MRRPRSPLQPNPFVVLADLAIALTFLFAVISIAYSREQSERNRNETQAQVRTSLTSTLKDSLDARKKNMEEVCVDEGGARLSCEDPAVARHDIVAKGRLVSRVWRNGSYQRIQTYDMFDVGSSRVRISFEPSLNALIRQVRDKFVANSIEYVNLHGTAELEESKSPDDRADLSVKRAEALRRMFVTAGALPDDRAIQAMGDSRGSIEETAYWRDRRMIDPGRLIAYGKENLYRAGQGAGRVDIILFYTDKIQKK